MKSIIIDNMIEYNMTTSLPITLMTAQGVIMHQIDAPSVPVIGLNDLSQLPYMVNGKSIYANKLSDYHENYLVMYTESSDKVPMVMIVGPFLYHKFSHEDILEKTKNLPEAYRMNQALTNYYNHLPLAKSGSVSKHFNYLTSLFNLEDISFDQILMSNKSLDNIVENLIEYREIDFYHHDYLEEKLNLDGLFKGHQNHFYSETLNKKHEAVLAEDHLRNKKNLAIVGLAVFERYTIDKGLDSHIAFTMGDAAIRYVEKCESITDIDMMMHSTFLKYKKALDLVTGSKYSKIINDTIQYVNRHLTEKLYIGIVAENVNISESYLSKLVKKELKMTFTDYVMLQRINESTQMLKHSKNTMAEIAGFLNFSSKSYFLKCFKKTIGLTPKQYLNSNRAV